jgi:hypothetical protein
VTRSLRSIRKDLIAIGSVVIELGQSQTAPTPGQEAPCRAPSERQAGAASHGPDGEILTAKATNFAADQNPGRP